MRWNKQPPAWQNPTEERIINQNLSSSKLSENEHFPLVTFRRAAAVHHAAGHVLAVARITLHHHGGWLEDRHGDLCHGQLLMVCLLCRDNWCIGGQHEVDAWIWHQVGLEPWLQFIEIIQSNHPIIQYKRQTCPKRLQTNLPKLEVTKQQNCMTKLGLCFGPRNSVMSTFNAPSNRNEAVLNSWKEGERWKDVCKLLTPSKNTPRFTCCWNEAQWGDDLGNQPVQVGVSWTLDVQVPAANIVEGLVVLKKMRTRSMRGKRAITTTTTRRRRRTTTTTRRTTTFIHL